MKYLALLVVLILVGFATSNASPLVFVVRHAEKGAGDQKDPDLSAAGEKRAQALARMLKDAANYCCLYDGVQANAGDGRADSERNAAYSHCCSG